MAIAFTAEQKSKVIAALSQRGVSLPCSRCGNTNFTLLDKLAIVALGDGKTFAFGGGAENLPSVIVICTRCGATYLHSLGVLGLFEDFGFPVK